MSAEEAGAETRRYGRAAGLLSVGVGLTGLVTYLYFSLASHNLSAADYGEVVVLWSAVFITVSTLQRPVEQLLSRTISEHEARGQPIGHAMRVAAAIQLALATIFVTAALLLRGPLQDELLSGNRTLYWILIGAVAAYAASYFARGFLAGSRRFVLYSLLILSESISRTMFPLAVAIGVASGQSAVALGIIAAPCLSLVVVPFAFSRRARAAPAAGPPPGGRSQFTLGGGTGFAAAVLLIMLAEQTFLNAGVLIVNATTGAAAAGFMFNVLMIARAPIQLFQAVQTSLLPHLTRLHSSGREADEEAFRRSVRVTITAIAAFATFVAACVIAAGPDLMQIAFGSEFTYGRRDLLIVTAGLGVYLSASTLNQATLAQGQARRAAACWAIAAAAFVAWCLTPIVGDEFLRVEVGYLGGAVLLFALLYTVYRRPHPRAADAVEPGSAEEMELRLAAGDEAG